MDYITVKKLPIKLLFKLYLNSVGLCCLLQSQSDSHKRCVSSFSSRTSIQCFFSTYCQIKKTFNYAGALSNDSLAEHTRMGGIMLQCL